MVDEALARSRTGNIFSRSWRSLTGERIDDDLKPTVQYSDAAVIRLIDKVRRSVERPAKDATVKISGAGVEHDPRGRGARRLGLAAAPPDRRRDHVDDGAAHLRGQDAPHRSRRSPRRTSSASTTRSSSSTAASSACGCSRTLKPTQTFGIAVGQVGLETPAGQYTIANKAINPAWHVPNSAWAGKLAGKVIPGDDPTNPIKARWLGIFDGVGIHGTSDDASIGHNASHGCIRMHIPDVEKLYDEVPGGLRRLHRLV